MKREKPIIFLLKIYFLFVFFYGIVIRLTIDIPILFELKTYVPELILIVVAVWAFFNGNKKLSKWQWFGTVYFGAVILLNIVFYGISHDALYCFRDTYIPLFAFIFIQCYEFSEDSLRKFYDFLVKLSSFYLIGGAIFGAVEMFAGWKFASKFYTGYVFYEMDVRSKIRITHAMDRLRSPGFSGNCTTFCFYTLVALAVLLSDEKISKKRKFFFIVLECAVIVETFNKTAVIVLFFLFWVYLFRRYQNRIRKIVSAIVRKLGVKGFVAIVTVIAAAAAAAVVNAFVVLFAKYPDLKEHAVFFSVFDRFRLWKTLGESVHWSELLFPYKSFLYNPNAEGILGFWDNTYLFLAFSVGIAGLLWVYVYSWKVSRQNSRRYPDLQELFKLLVWIFLLSSLTTNLFNGRSYFVLYALLLSLYAGDWRFAGVDNGRNNTGKKRIKKCAKMLLKVFYLFPLKNNRVVFKSFNGKAYSDSPKAIAEYILQHEQKKEFRLYWVCSERKAFVEARKKGIRLVKAKSLKYLYIMMTSKFIICNIVPSCTFPYRKKQRILDTWHGFGPKYVGKYVKGYDPEEFAPVTDFLSTGKLYKELYLKDCLEFKGTVHNTGFPRNDLLFGDTERQKASIKRLYHIEADLLILYAPTFRGTFEKEKTELDPRAVREAFEKKYNRKTAILYRAHPMISALESSQYKEAACDVSKYPDMQELLAACDVLITDYSSSMWDVILPSEPKPVFLYAPDYELYKEERGFILDPHDWPFAMAENMEELVNSIERFAPQKYKNKVRTFKRKCKVYEEGDASRKVFELLRQWKKE